MRVTHTQPIKQFNRLTKAAKNISVMRGETEYPDSMLSGYQDTAAIEIGQAHYVIRPPRTALAFTSKRRLSALKAVISSLRNSGKLLKTAIQMLK